MKRFLRHPSVPCTDKFGKLIIKLKIVAKYFFPLIYLGVYIIVIYFWNGKVYYFWYWTLFFLLCQWSHENRKKITRRYNFIKENDHLKVNWLVFNKHAWNYWLIDVRYVKANMKFENKVMHTYNEERRYLFIHIATCAFNAAVCLLEIRRDEAPSSGNCWYNSVQKKTVKFLPYLGTVFKRYLTCL